MKSKIFLKSEKSFSTKAQLTMFVILGIVIISVFGFVFFASGRIARQNVEVQTEKILNDVLARTPLNTYVNLCTQRALKDGIDLLSRQGGKIFPGQNGSIMKFNEVVYPYRDVSKDVTYKVGYGILRNTVQTPQYPCTPGFDNYNEPPAYCAYKNIPEFKSLDFGIVNLPVLCKNRFEGCSIEREERWDSRFSVQKELEEYLAYAVDNCVDFESIAEINQTYDMEKGNVTANVTFSDNSISASVNFPIYFSPINAQPVIKLLSFQSTVQTRFKQAYAIARQLVVHDVSSEFYPGAPIFDIKKNFEEIIKRTYGENSGFDVEIFENVSLKDNFVRITDTRASSGNQLVIQFAIENRPPVLEYIGSYDSPIIKPCGSYDLYALQDQLLEIYPNAFDTEEDALKFNYSGWLKDYNETFTVIGKNQCGAIVVSNQKKFTNAGDSRWILDATFDSSGVARAYVTEKDIGFHNLTITVCDSQFCDYQTIRILVDDLLKISVNKTNIYGNSLFSIEDPFTFTATIEDLYNPGDYKFSWKIYNTATPQSLIYVNDSGNQELNLPLTSYNIENITQKYRSSGFLPNQFYSVVAETIQQAMKVTNDTKAVLLQCIPFTNGKPPYPYGDPFLSNHACCQSDPATGVVSIKANTASCYSNTTYGSIFSFNLNKFETNYDKIRNLLPLQTTIGLDSSAGNPNSIYGTLGLFSKAKNEKSIFNNTNDIFKRTFERLCGGRGNMCNGTMTEKYEVIENCKDKNPVTEIATCYGPSPAMLNANSESTSVSSCYNYGAASDKGTFEDQLGLKSDKICSVRAKCVPSNNANNAFDLNPTGARYYCNATCGTTTGCKKTIPSLCVDCYAKQTCSGPTLDDIEKSDFIYTPHSITFKKFSTCLDNTQNHLTDGCSISQEIVQKDFCNGNILTKYLCGDYQNEVNFNKTATINCNNYQLNAEATTNGCKEYSIPSCETIQTGGKCTTSTPQEYTNPGPKKIQSYVYEQYVVDDTNIKACKLVQTDFDGVSMQNRCTSTLFSGTGFSNDLGYWISNACCGDDLNEKLVNGVCQTTPGP